VSEAKCPKGAIPKQKFTIKNEDAKKRLDIFLANALKDKYSRSFIKQIIKDGFVLVNNKGAKVSYRLKQNDEITLTPPPPKIPSVVTENIPVEIIYEDKDIIVVNKPAGMVVHPAYGNYSHTLVNALLFHCDGKLANLGSPLRPGVVHRLDKDVSGLIVLAKTDIAYRELIRQFKQRSIIKKYIAFVKGKVPLQTGKIELPIGRSIRNRKKMAVTLAGRGAKSAVTHYKVLKKFKGFTKLLISIETGRTHQIRVHTSYMGHPILGDTRYGGPKALPNGRQAGRVMLHAISLKFKHPIKGNDLYFESPLPVEFKKLEEQEQG